MKGLSIKEPHAGRIADGRKLIETRKWKTNYRGPVLICASNVPAIGFAGFAIAIVNLIDCRPMQYTDKWLALVEHDPHLFSFVLDDIWRLPKPLRARGSLYLWEIDEFHLTKWPPLYERHYLQGCFRCKLSNFSALGERECCSLKDRERVQSCSEACCPKVIIHEPS